MRRTESMNSLASTVVFISQTDLCCLSPINEDVSQGSKNSSQRSSPVKTTEEGSSPNSSLIKREAGNLLNAQLMLVSKRFEQENLKRWFKLWKDGAVLQRSLKKVGSERMRAGARVRQRGGASGEAVEIQRSSPAKSTEKGRGSSQEGDHVYLDDRKGVRVEVLRIGSELFDIKETHESPQSSSVSEQWLYKNHENRSENSAKFALDVETLKKMLIRVVGGGPVDSDIYFNGVLIAEYILPSSDVAGVRKVQSGSVATIVNALDILANNMKHLNHYREPPNRVPPRKLRNNFIYSLESVIGKIADKETFGACMLKADASSLRYLIKEVIRGAVDRWADSREGQLDKLAFGDEFDDDHFWPDEATRKKISGEKISLGKVRELLNLSLCEQRHFNWKHWQRVLLEYDEGYLQSKKEFKVRGRSFTNSLDKRRMKGGEQFEGFKRQFKEHRLLLLLLMREARKRAVTMDQLKEVYYVERERIFSPPEPHGVQWPRRLHGLYTIDSFLSRFRGIVRANT